MKQETILSEVQLSLDFSGYHHDVTLMNSTERVVARVVLEKMKKELNNRALQLNSELWNKTTKIIEKYQERIDEVASIFTDQLDQIMLELQAEVLSLDMEQQ